MIIYSPTFTGSVQITGSQTVTGDLTVQGNLTAQTFILSSSVSYFTESFASGSTRFGDSADDNMIMTGSFKVSGSLGGGFVITGSSGYVGVGVTAPRNLLHIHSGSTAFSSPTGLSTTTVALFSNQTVYSDITVLSNSSYGSGINLGDNLNASSGSILQFGGTAGEGGRMRIVAGGIETMNLRGGNVGIGTASPLAPLQVNGNFRLYTSNGDGNELRGIFNVGGAADPLSFSMYKANATTIGTFITSDGTSYFNGGNVLIGTSTDGGYKLLVAGTSYVNGSFLADSMRTLEGTVSNPYNVWTTMFTVSTNTVAIYYVIAVSQGNGLTYTTSAMVVVNDGGVGLHNYVPAGALTLQTSGYDVQVKNGSGSTMVITYKFIKMA